MKTSWLYFCFVFSPVTYSQSKIKMLKDFFVTERTAKRTQSRQDKIVLRTLKSCFVEVEDVAAFSQKVRMMKELLNNKEYTGRNFYKT